MAGRSFLALAGGTVARQMLTLGAQLLVARRLGSGEYGLLTLAFSAYILMAGLADLGTRLHCWRVLAALAPADRPARASALLGARSMYALLVAVGLNAAIAAWAPANLAALLHVFTLAVIFNQISLDWLFLGSELNRPLFLFHLCSGVVFFTGCWLTVQGPGDAGWFPFWMAVSYLLPMPWLLRGRLVWPALWSAMAPDQVRALVQQALPLAPYDFLQRLYAVFVFLVMGLHHATSQVGEFRVAYLAYSFVASFALYFSGSKFGDLMRATPHAVQQRITQGVLTVVLATLPLLLAGGPAATLLLDQVLGKGFASTGATLQVVFLCLPLVAAATYLRECLIPIGQQRLATLSYLLTIGLTSLLLLSLPRQDNAGVALMLVAGESTGLVLILWRSGLVRPAVHAWPPMAAALGAAALLMAGWMGLRATLPGTLLGLLCAEAVLGLAYAAAVLGLLRLLRRQSRNAEALP